MDTGHEFLVSDLLEHGGSRNADLQVAWGF